MCESEWFKVRLDAFGMLDVKFLERCPSGLRYTLGRGAWQKCHLGFESPSFRNKKKSLRDFFLFQLCKFFLRFEARVEHLTPRADSAIVSYGKTF